MFQKLNSKLKSVLFIFVLFKFILTVVSQQQPQNTCVRICSIMMDDNKVFNFTQIQPNWCSHIILHFATLNFTTTKRITITNTIKAHFIAFYHWNTFNKPLLSLSIRNNERFNQDMLYHHVHDLYGQILRIIKDYGLSGIHISWRGRNDGFSETRMKQFLQLYAYEKKYVIISLESKIINSKNFKYIELDENVDYIILEDYKPAALVETFTAVNHTSSKDLLSANFDLLAADWNKKGIPSSMLVVDLDKFQENKEMPEIEIAEELCKRQIGIMVFLKNSE